MNEKQLLGEVALLAGKINKHKRELRKSERQMLQQVATLAGRINRHKQAQLTSATGGASCRVF